MIWVMLSAIHAPTLYKENSLLSSKKMEKGQTLEILLQRNKVDLQYFTPVRKHTQIEVQWAYSV